MLNPEFQSLRLRPIGRANSEAAREAPVEVPFGPPPSSYADALSAIRQLLIEVFVYAGSVEHVEDAEPIYRDRKIDYLVDLIEEHGIEAVWCQANYLATRIVFAAPRSIKKLAAFFMASVQQDWSYPKGTFVTVERFMAYSAPRT